MITKKRKVSQIPSTTVLTQDSKILIVQNGTTATISALDILAGVSGISAAHLVDFNNPHQVTKAQIGLGNVDNTSDANKPVSTLVQSALNLKQDVLVSGTNIKTINGVSILGSGNIDGYVKIKDRSKDVIISGGENISSIEVEEVLFKHPAVSLAAVVAKPDPKWGEVPCAYVELKADAKATEEEVIDYCKQHLARFKVPKQIVFVELPKTSTGKIQKFKLREFAKSSSAIE